MNKKFKALTSIVVITVILLLTAMPFGAVTVKRYYGDINCDGMVSIEDARIALMIAAKIYTEDLTKTDLKAADVTSDGAYTTADARAILRLAAGLDKKKVMGNYDFSENPTAFLNKINSMRLAENPKATKLTLSEDLCTAAKEAAREYTELTGSAFLRENGEYYFYLLNEMGIPYTFADKAIIQSGFGYQDAFKKFTQNTQSRKALLSENFNKIGIGAYSKDGINFYWCIFLVKD